MKQLDYSQITDQIFVGRTPRQQDYQTLKDLGITLLINMRAEWPAPVLRKQKLIRDIWVPSFDNPVMFVGSKRLYRISLLVQAELDAGGKIYVFCRKGRHRSVAMASAILLVQDRNTTYAQLVSLFARTRPVADLRAYQVKRSLRRLEEQLENMA